ncbi:MAG: NAD-dependent epimerase/dehydratase family protein [Blastocatellia bacterium]
MVQRRYLVTGGAGFIGSHLVERLLGQEATHGVTVIDNFDDFYDPAIKWGNVETHRGFPAWQLVNLDLRDGRGLEEVFRTEAAEAGGNAPFETIVHLAARAGVRPSVADPLLYQQVNVGGTVQLLELARRFGVKKFIFASSSSIYGPEASVPFREDAPLSPISPYAATKAAGELFAHTYSHLYGIKMVCLRFFTVYGPRQRPDLAIHKFARQILSGTPIHVYGDGSAERDFTYIDDILQGVLAAIEYEKTDFEIINLGESETISVTGMIALLEEALGRRAIVEYHPAQPGDLPRTHADIGKARRLLGYHPSIPLGLGIGKFVEWLRAQTSR